MQNAFKNVILHLHILKELCVSELPWKLKYIHTCVNTFIDLAIPSLPTSQFTYISAYKVLLSVQGFLQKSTYEYGNEWDGWIYEGTHLKVKNILMSQASNIK